MNLESANVGAIDKLGTSPKAMLRILETTDLHMQLLAYDYFSDQADEGTGLSNLVDAIERLRSEDGVTTLLFDNGDFLQGNPLADYLAAQEPGDQPHPMIAAFNMLDYDAITLGNHEFNYGLPFLERTLKAARFPIVCANLHHLNGGNLARPYIVLDRKVTCDDGQTRTIRLGITGVLPPQIMAWDKTLLTGQVETDDIVAAVQKVVPKMQAEGADIIVALCHSGIGPSEHQFGMENAAIPLAGVDGIDVVLTGHTHEMFPGTDRSASDVVDPRAGTLHGKPTVMAGFYGNFLGVVDLTISNDAGQWRIVDHTARLQPGQSRSKPSGGLRKRLMSEVGAAHQATLNHIRQPIAKTQVPIHSYFATIKPDMTQHLLAQAQKAFITDALAQTDHADLPVLSATAPFRAGGMAGPAHYIDIAPGPLALRDAAAIYPFSNTLCALRQTGAQLREWLERAASHFNQITVGQHDQPLIRPRSAAYNCDTLFGLSYEFDLTQPARFDAEGIVENPTARRVTSVTHNGRMVEDNDVFVVATNSYRAHGGGGFPFAYDQDLLHVSVMATRDALVDYLRRIQTVTQTAPASMRFRSLEDTSAIFNSSPAAQTFITSDINHIGSAPDGFATYRLTL